MLKPTIQNIKDLFTRETGLNADEKPADFSAFLFIKNQSMLNDAYRTFRNYSNETDPVTAKKMASVFSRLVLSDNLVYNLKEQGGE